jgi:molybdopterin molybdotransferase
MSCDANLKALSVTDALSKLLATVPAFDATEKVELGSALGRVLADNLVSGINVPPADNSAMDGYAVNTRSLEANDYRLSVSQRVAAGYTPEPLAPNSAARIFTGAEVPEGADAVVMQEQCTLHGNMVHLPTSVKAGQNIRRGGQDIQSGAEILSQGIRLQPQHLGLIASIGIRHVPVFKRLKVAVLSTGDELLEPGEPASPGKIYNSNRYALSGLIGALGMEFVDLGIVADTAQATEAALRQAASEADCIITSGGVSVGEEDHVKPAIERLGKLDLWKVAIKPGKPIALGEVLGVPLIGLPGNPVSAFVTFCLFARPFLLKYQGVKNILPRAGRFKADFEKNNRSIRTEYLRAQLVTGDDGDTLVRIFENQSSGVLTSTCWAHGFAILPPEETISRGESIEFLHYAELLN